MKGIRSCITLVICATTASGCSINRLAVDKVGDALAGGGGTYATDDDPELVGAALPFGLKLIESLLAQSPEHRGMLSAAASGYTQYAYGFVQLPAEQLEQTDLQRSWMEKDRARRLYLRARDYGLRGLALGRPGFAQRFREDPGPPFGRRTGATLNSSTGLQPPGGPPLAWPRTIRPWSATCHASRRWRTGPSRWIPASTAAPSTAS